MIDPVEWMRRWRNADKKGADMANPMPKTDPMVQSTKRSRAGFPGTYGQKRGQIKRKGDS